jgi:hypothetical protein
MASVGSGLPSHKSTIVKQLMSNGIKEAQLSKKDIFTFNSKANAAIAYRNLIKEIFDL